MQAVPGQYARRMYTRCDAPMQLCQSKHFAMGKQKTSSIFGPRSNLRRTEQAPLVIIISSLAFRKGHGKQRPLPPPNIRLSPRSGALPPPLFETIDGPPVYSCLPFRSMYLTRTRGNKKQESCFGRNKKRDRKDKAKELPAYMGCLYVMLNYTRSLIEQTSSEQYSIVQCYYLYNTHAQ